MTVERGIAGSARRWESMDTIRKRGRYGVFPPYYRLPSRPCRGFPRSAAGDSLWLDATSPRKTFIIARWRAAAPFVIQSETGMESSSAARTRALWRIAVRPRLPRSVVTEGHVVIRVRATSFKLSRRVHRARHAGHQGPHADDHRPDMAGEIVEVAPASTGGKPATACS